MFWSSVNKIVFGTYIGSLIQASQGTLETLNKEKVAFGTSWKTVKRKQLKSLWMFFKTRRKFASNRTVKLCHAIFLWVQYLDLEIAQFALYNIYCATIWANAIYLLICTLKIYWTIMHLKISNFIWNVCMRGHCKRLWDTVHQSGIWAHLGDLECRIRKYFTIHSTGVDESVTLPRGGILNGIYICSAGRFYC